MSDSDDFGGLQPTTPALPRPKPGQGKKVASSRGEAGNGKTNGNAAKRKRPAKDDGPTVIEDEEEEPEVQEIPPVQTKRSRPQKPSKPPLKENGHSVDGDDGIEETEPVRSEAKKVAGKGKGRSKPGPGRNSERSRTGDDAIEVADDDDEAAEPSRSEHVDGPNGSRSRHRSRDVSGAPTANDPAAAKELAKREATMAKLQLQLDQANKHIEELTRQLDEINRVRTTEPEALMKQMEIQHQQEIQAKDSLISDLTDKLSRKDPFFRSNKSIKFEILTREDVDKETEGLQEQVEKWKEKFRAQEEKVQQRDYVIEELKTKEKDLQTELRMERDARKAAESKRTAGTPSAAPRPAYIAAGEDVKNAAVVRFYEDLTNLLVVSMRFTNSSQDKEECIMKCVYSYHDVLQPESLAKSLTFTLRLFQNTKEDENGNPILVDSVQYQPMDLDKETEEFRNSLEFLGDTFVFEKNQLSLFIRTMHENISGIKDDESSDMEQG